MPNFLEDLAEVLPGFPALWTEFCYHEGEASRPWEAKLNDDVRCLDREWRKLVFKLFDYMRMTLGLPNHHYIGDKRRLETIIYPVSSNLSHRAFGTQYSSVVSTPLRTKLLRPECAQRLTKSM